MKLFLVRFKEDKDIVGILACEHEDDLFMLVDECCDPHDCEAMEIKSLGGIFWHNHNCPKVGVSVRGDNFPDFFKVEEINFSECWQDFIYFNVPKKSWKDVA